MSQMIDLANLTPEAIEQLRAVLGTTTAGTRSPVWKPLRDMRMPTTQKGKLNRPHFEWSADPPPEGTFIPEFPRLFWDAKGNERKIERAEDMHLVQAEWTPSPPMFRALDPMEQMRADFEALSEADQTFVLNAQRQQRLERMQMIMSNLSEADLLSLKKSEPAKAKKSA